MRTRRPPQYLLRLFITGSRPLSLQAVANIRAVCEDELRGRYRLEVVDVYQQPELARRSNVRATPMLIRRLPPPLRSIVGRLAERARVEVGLKLVRRP